MNLDARINASLKNPANITYQNAEADAIVEFMHGIDTWIDVGCFHGGLSHAVLRKLRDRGFAIRNILLVDPIFEYLDNAVGTLTIDGFRCVGLNAAVMPGMGFVTVRVLTSDSISASGVSSLCPFEGEDRSVDAVTAASLLENFPMSTTFLKIDAEYMDLDIIMSLADTLYRPKVIELEIIDMARYQRETRHILTRMGYPAPYLPASRHRYFSLITQHLHPADFIDGPFKYLIVAFEKFEIYEPADPRDKSILVVTLRDGFRATPRNMLSKFSWRDPRIKSLRPSKQGT